MRSWLGNNVPLVLTYIFTDQMSGQWRMQTQKVMGQKDATNHTNVIGNLYFTEYIILAFPVVIEPL